MATPSRKTREIIERILGSLDPEQIGDVYCDDGGADFFETMRPRILEDGFAWGESLVKRLRKLGDSIPQRSLYVGAGLAELPVLVMEAVDLGRKLVVTNLREEECQLLNRALKHHGVLPKQVEYRAIDASAAVADGGHGGEEPFSHVSMVSVLTDPETFPVASALAYGRVPLPLLDTKKFESERKRIRALVAAVLGAASVPCLVTTTSEEAPWVAEWAGAPERDLLVDPDDEMLRAAVVGDPIGFLRLRARPASKGDAAAVPS